MVDYKKIGMRIRKQRNEKGLSQELLAEKAEVSLSFIGHIERGTRVLSVETLARLCQVLEMDMHYIVFGYSSAEKGLLSDLKELLQKY